MCEVVHLFLLVYMCVRFTMYAFCLVSGLIFVVDSNDRERVNEARDEMMRMLQEDELRRYDSFYHLC